MANVIKKLKARRDFLAGQRGTWEQHWQEIAEYVIPRKDNITVKRWPGEKRNVNLLDTTAEESNQLLAAALHSMLTNPSSRWFEFTTGIPQLDDMDDVRDYFRVVEDQMLNTFNNSNFQTEVHELYLDMGAFGTSIMSVEEDKKAVLKFKTHPLSHGYIDENAFGIVDTLYRDFHWDAFRIYDKYVKDPAKAMEMGMPQAVRDAYEKMDTGTKFKILLAIYPNRKEFGDEGSQPFIARHIICVPADDGRAEGVVLKQEGFNEFPYVAPRWLKSSGEMYGRGPGFTALPVIKTVNKMMEVVLIAAQKTIDPPLQLPDDGFVLPIITKPGGLNFRRGSSANDKIEPIFNQTQVDFGFEVMNEQRLRVQKAFFVDELKLPGGPQKTATEVLQRVEEQMRFLGPVMGRMQSEFLRPMIDRAFSIMDRRGMFPEPPEILSERDVDVRYNSLVARAQRNSEGNDILRTVEAAAPFIQLNPDAADNFDSDKAVREISKIFGTDGLLRKKREIVEVREARDQAQQEQLQTQETLQAVDAAAKLQAVQGQGQAG